MFSAKWSHLRQNLNVLILSHPEDRSMKPFLFSDYPFIITIKTLWELYSATTNSRPTLLPGTRENNPRDTEPSYISWYQGGSNSRSVEPSKSINTKSSENYSMLKTPFIWIETCRDKAGMFSVLGELETWSWKMLIHSRLAVKNFIHSPVVVTTVRKQTFWSFHYGCEHVYFLPPTNQFVEILEKKCWFSFSFSAINDLISWDKCTCLWFVSIA